MSNKNVSSVMVMRDDRLIGLVTDRDLRKRCVAIGLNGTEPIDQIMTPDPKVITASTLTAQALMTMTRMRVHHLPVTRNGKLAGMITATDLANHQSANSAYLAADLRKAKSVLGSGRGQQAVADPAPAPGKCERDGTPYR